MKQHHKPCANCPFSRACTPGELGGSPVETFIGQAYGSFWIPCHERIDYTDDNWRREYKVYQCAGTAIYRSNCHPAKRPKELLELPKDTELVFSSPAEFLSHHRGISIENARELLYHLPPHYHWVREMQDVKAEFITGDELR